MNKWSFPNNNYFQKEVKEFEIPIQIVKFPILLEQISYCITVHILYSTNIQYHYFSDNLPNILTNIKREFDAF